MKVQVDLGSQVGGEVEGGGFVVFDCCFVVVEVVVE